MRRSAWTSAASFALALIVVAAVHAPLAAQNVAYIDSARLDSLFQAHRHPVTLRGGTLTGPGANLLAAASRNVQFFVIAESHYVGEVPPLTSALYDVLHRSNGVRYYAIEYGPVIGKMLSTAPLRGDTAAIIAFAARNPHAFHFLNDEELETMAHIGARSNRDNAIWGVDNEFGAAHVLDRLVAIAPSDSARGLASRLAREAREIERDRSMSGELKRFISSVDSLEFDRLRTAFGSRASEEARQLIDALELSNRVYTFNARAGAGELTGYRANLDREQYQKAQFMRNYRQAQRAGDSTPAVLVKTGSLHGGKWLGSTNVHSLGNFLHEFATANGRESFHLVTWLVNKPGDYWSIAEERGYEPLGRAGNPSEWVIVDFRPLRPLVHAGVVRGLSANLRAAIFAYDAVLLIGSGTKGTYESLLEAQRNLR